MEEYGFVWIWPSKVWCKTAALTKIEVQRWFLKYLRFNPPVTQDLFGRWVNNKHKLYKRLLVHYKYTIIPSFTKLFQVIVVATLGKNLGPPMPKLSNNSCLPESQGPQITCTLSMTCQIDVVNKLTNRHVNAEKNILPFKM